MYSPGEGTRRNAEAPAKEQYTEKVVKSQFRENESIATPRIGDVVSDEPATWADGRDICRNSLGVSIGGGLLSNPALHERANALLHTL